MTLIWTAEQYAEQFRTQEPWGHEMNIPWYSTEQDWRRALETARSRLSARHSITALVAVRARKYLRRTSGSYPAREHVANQYRRAMNAMLDGVPR
jgi:hypothetical protein